MKKFILLALLIFSLNVYSQSKRGNILTVTTINDTLMVDVPAKSMIYIADSNYIVVLTAKGSQGDSLVNIARKKLQADVISTAGGDSIYFRFTTSNSSDGWVRNDTLNLRNDYLEWSDTITLATKYDIATDTGLVRTTGTQTIYGLKNIRNDLNIIHKYSGTTDDTLAFKYPGDTIPSIEAYRLQIKTDDSPSGILNIDARTLHQKAVNFKNNAHFSRYISADSLPVSTSNYIVVYDTTSKQIRQKLLTDTFVVSNFRSDAIEVNDSLRLGRLQTGSRILGVSQEMLQSKIKFMDDNNNLVYSLSTDGTMRDERDSVIIDFKTKEIKEAKIRGCLNIDVDTINSCVDTTLIRANLKFENNKNILADTMSIENNTLYIGSINEIQINSKYTLITNSDSMLLSYYNIDNRINNILKIDSSGSRFNHNVTIDSTLILKSKVAGTSDSVLIFEDNHLKYKIMSGGSGFDSTHCYTKLYTDTIEGCSPTVVNNDLKVSGIMTDDKCNIFYSISTLTLDYPVVDTQISTFDTIITNKDIIYDNNSRNITFKKSGLYKITFNSGQLNLNSLISTDTTLIGILTFSLIKNTDQILHTQSVNERFVFGQPEGFFGSFNPITFSILSYLNEDDYIKFYVSIYEGYGLSYEHLQIKNTTLTIEQIK